ncbi:DUF4192 family protein [Brevibacterium linens]|uniref:DUF4192 family protein n=1 Tax=Brevibacterium linens TaxID=1703 RepID=UPI003BF53786
MTSEQFAIRTIEELAAATYSVTVRGTNRYIFGGGNKAGEFLTFSLSFEDFDRADGQLGRELTDTLQVGIVIVETDDDADALTRSLALGELIPQLVIATLVGDDLRLNGKVYRMEELTLDIPEPARPKVTPLTLWEESGERRFEPVGPAGPFHTPDEAAGVLHALVEAVEAGDVPDEHLVSQIAVMYQEINTRDRVLGVALGDHPEDGFDPSAKRFIAALRDPDVTFSTQEGWRPILQFIAAHVTDDVAAHAWANAGAYAWLTGRMALAARCAERAQAADPENSFAKLIITATDTGSRPAHILKKMNG